MLFSLAMIDVVANINAFDIFSVHWKAIGFNGEATNSIMKIRLLSSNMQETIHVNNIRRLTWKSLTISTSLLTLLIKKHFNHNDEQ